MIGGLSVPLSYLNRNHYSGAISQPSILCEKLVSEGMEEEEKTSTRPHPTAEPNQNDEAVESLRASFTRY